METAGGLSALEAGGGCAAKYSAARLEELLRGFAPADSENLLVGLAPADDAAVYRLSDEQALIFTVDFFPPLVDDPAVFGAIAATNALNDVFAMGGRPLLALSVAAFPEELDVGTVREVFDAAAAKVAEAGAVLAGGHTIRDAEPKYGLAVVGTAHPDSLWRKSGARPGDAVLLTKPLGTGLVLAGARRGVVGEAELAAAVDAMTTLNAAAAEALRAFEPTAATDVTGFGLLGHARELAERSGVQLVLEAERLPALPGAVAAAEAGVRTGGDPRNREYVADALELDGVSEGRAALAFDPQTAGGLLVTLPADRAAVAEATVGAVRIGQVVDGSGVRLA
ncbi:MAG TPA: selenide, water dikinase SelD [Gaiellaceae bacterium]|jgi:selenide,water dikinase|nr:selenide, water dikinase SelD [Gaiellaceae bacterium]